MIHAYYSNVIVTSDRKCENVVNPCIEDIAT